MCGMILCIQMVLLMMIVEEDQNNNTSTSIQAAIMTWDENFILVTIVTVVGVGVIRAHL